MAAHIITVVDSPSHGYRYYAQCSCGFKTRRMITAEAAVLYAQDHEIPIMQSTIRYS